MPTFRGKPACSCLVEWLPEYERELKRRGGIKHSIDIYQLVGGAKASAGTHSQGGAYDIAQTSDLAIQVAREMGAAAWHRKPPAFTPHQHGVLNGCPHNGPARYQVIALAAGYNGLGRGGRGGWDDGPGPRQLRTWREGIRWAKALQKAAVPAKHTRWTTAETHVHATPGGKTLRLLPKGYRFGVVTGSGKGGWVQTTSGKWVRGAKTTKTKPAVSKPARAPKGVPSKWAKVAHFLPYSRNNDPAGLDLAVAGDYPAIDLDFQMSTDGIFFNAHWATLREEKLADPRGEIPSSARLDSLTWAQIKRLRRKDGSRLHSAGTMLRLAAKRGLRVEVEAKATAASVRHGMGDVAAWRRLKAAADQAGCEVQVKILTDFPVWPRVLKAAHAAGLVTILLPRGSRRVSKRHWPYIDYVRGAVRWEA